MAMYAEWEVVDQSKPVEKILFSRTPEGTELSVLFRTASQARMSFSSLQILDADCRLQGDSIVMSKHITPQQLGKFLVSADVAKIDHACNAELQREMDIENEGPGGGRNAR